MHNMPNAQTCPHPGKPVKVGSYRLYAGAMADMTPESLRRADILIILCENVPAEIWSTKFTGTHVWAYPIKDYQEPRGPWEKFIREVEKSLKNGKRVFVCCEGGHGRTGTFLASLISLVERPVDPIAIVRERYCAKAVETPEQTKAIFALTGRKMPPQYADALQNSGDAVPLLQKTAEA